MSQVLGLGHPEHMIAAIDADDLARGAGAVVRHQIDRGAADRLEGRVRAQRRIGLGLPEGLADAIAGWDVGASKGALFSDSKQLSELIGRPTTPLAVAVKAALA